MALSYLYIVVCAPCHESIRVEGVLCKLNGRISPPTKIIVRLDEFLRVGVHSSDVLYDIGNVRPHVGAKLKTVGNLHPVTVSFSAILIALICVDNSQ